MACTEYRMKLELGSWEDSIVVSDVSVLTLTLIRKCNFIARDLTMVEPIYDECIPKSIALNIVRLIDGRTNI